MSVATVQAYSSMAHVMVEADACREINVVKSKLVVFGIGGTVAAALCCFTPLLPVVLGGIGLAGLLNVIYNDAVLLPILAGFLTLTGYALWRQKKQQ